MRRARLLAGALSLLFAGAGLTTAVVDGRVKEIRDTACREPEGGWRGVG